jgi:hypothetical protein
MDDDDDDDVSMVLLNVRSVPQLSFIQQFNSFNCLLPRNLSPLNEIDVIKQYRTGTKLRTTITTTTIRTMTLGEVICTTAIVYYSIRRNF